MTTLTEKIRLPVDQPQRERALDPRKSFIIQAPAGSGKTELLVRRYLKLLAYVDAPEKILAITFTKKATAEMRMRICNALNHRKANGEAEDSKELLALADAARANDAKHNWQILANTRRLKIQTIDSFCNELVRRMPWSARFGAPPDIIEDTTLLYQQSSKMTLDYIEQDSAWASASQQLLKLVDADWNKAQGLLASMLGKRDKWMRVLGGGYLTHDPEKVDHRAHLEQMWQEHIDAELEKTTSIISKISKNLPVTLMELGAFAANNLMEADIDSPITALHNAKKFPPATHQFMEQWRGIADLILTKGGGVRKRITKNQGFPPEEVEQKNRVVALLAKFAAHPEAYEALRIVRLLPPPKFSDEQWSSLAALMQLLCLAAAQLRLLFKEANQTDYIELTQRAEMALGDPQDSNNPSDLALAFDYQIMHLLVDEFQDTSTAHIELLTKLTSGWQYDDGRTLFFVGDPMQSIYRFREAEVGNFLQVWEDKRLGDISVEHIALETNFRSDAELVGWFNSVFQEVMPKYNDKTNSAVRYAKAQPYHKLPAQNENQNPISTQIHPGIARSPKEEADAIATLIEQTQQQQPDQSIAVLGRTRSHLSEIAITLRQRGIAFQAVELEKLNERPATRDLFAITRALVQPADRIAWLSLLRAPWCGMCLADLVKLSGKPNHAKTIEELWADEKLVNTLSKPGQDQLKRLKNSLSTALEKRGRISIRENVESAWLSLHGPATISEFDLDDCQRYLDLLSRMEERQIEINADNLKQESKDLWAQSGSEMKVQLLTIHKAKGLEFDTVVLPRLDGVPRTSDKPLLRWHKFPQQLLIAPLPSSVEQDDPFFQYLAHVEKTHEQNEIRRLLYVACTRACKNLHLFGSATIKASQAKSSAKEDGADEPQFNTPAVASMLALLWSPEPLTPLVKDEYVKVEESRSAEKKNDAVSALSDAEQFQPRPIQKLPSQWSPPALPQAIPVNELAADSLDLDESIEFSWAGEIARLSGTVIHQILQQVDPDNWQQWSKQGIDENHKQQWRNQLVEVGVPQNNLEAALSRVVTAIDGAQNDSRAAWIFSNAHRDIKTEWPLAGLADNKVIHMVIDRSFVDEDGVCWIVDFKSSFHEGADIEKFLNKEQERYQEKMEQYATVVRQLQPREVRLGLYFPALKGWREWAGAE